MGTHRPVAKTPPGDAVRCAPEFSGTGESPRIPLPPRRGRAVPVLVPVLMPAVLLIAGDAACAFAVGRAMLGGAEQAAAAASGALVLLNLSGGLYRLRRLPGPAPDLRPLATRALAVVAGLAVLTPAFSGPRGTGALTRPLTGPAVGAGSGAVEWLAGWLAEAALFVLAPWALRCAAHRALRLCARFGRDGTRGRPPALVVGTGVLSDYLVWSLRRRPEIGLLPLGRLAMGSPDGAGGTPVLGGPFDLRRVIESHGIETAVVVLDEIEHEYVEPAVRQCVEAGCETLVVPLSWAPSPPGAPIRAAAPGLPSGTGRVRRLAGVPCVPLTRRPYGPAARFLKRAFDLAVALLLLAVLWPLLLACALAVRWESGPGVLFRQSRIGLEGRPFVLLKFRTLRPADATEADTRWSVHGDDRIGPVGGFLRRTSLDELPQLWNVVRGDMSLVGPRPERPHFVRRFSETCPGYVLRHRVPVGMTGWAQVHGLRGDTSIEMRARFDNHYIDHWSFATDLKILLLTANAMIPRRRA